MPPASLRLAPSVPDLRALGAQDVEDLLGVGRPLGEEHRAEPLEEDAHSYLVRVPLPGTPCAQDGRLRGRPAGAGTGWVRLRRYGAAGPRAMLAARFTPPRSESLAEREWNLLCALRAAGVPAPEPLAVGSAGSGPFRRRSFLVTRELEDAEPALRWFARHGAGDERRRALRALGGVVGRLLRSGVRLPGLCPDQLVVVAPSAPPGGVGRLALRPLPTIALTSVRGGSLARPTVARALATLRRLAPPGAATPLSERERLRVLLLATRGWGRVARRRLHGLAGLGAQVRPLPNGRARAHLVPPMEIPPPGGDERPPLARALVGGFLMGLANLVPGISGGTMILAVGLYDRFVGAVADVTRLRLRPAALAFLGCLGVGLVTALVTLSGVAVDLVADQRWIMYSLFVGLTLGGAPALAARSRPVSPAVVAAALAGVAAIVALAMEFSGARLPETIPVLVAVGAAGAASMILPGISGSTVLLILGMYELVIGSLSVSALREDPAGSLHVLVPFVVGAGVGVALLSNLLKVLLARYPAPSHGALLGLLLGSVAILWPFQEPVHPDLARRATRKATVMVLAGESGDAVRERYGMEYDDERLGELAVRYEGRSTAELKELGDELRTFRPSLGQVGASLGLVAAGFLLTRLLGRRGD